jgi:hypothetical protein
MILVAQLKFEDAMSPLLSSLILFKKASKPVQPFNNCLLVFPNGCGSYCMLNSVGQDDPTGMSIYLVPMFH